MICGRIAGEVAAKRIRKGSSLDEYEREWRRQVGGPLEVAVKTKRLAMMAFGSQWRLEMAMRILGREAHGQDDPLPISFSLTGCSSACCHKCCIRVAPHRTPCRSPCISNAICAPL